MTDSPLTRRSLLQSAFLGPVAGVASDLAVAGDDHPDVHEEYLIDVHPGTSDAVWVRLDLSPGDAERLLYTPPAFVTVHTARGFDSLKARLRWNGEANPQIVYTVSPRFSWELADRWGFASTTELLVSADRTETTQSIRFPNGGYVHPDPTGQSFLGPCSHETRQIQNTEVTYVRPDRWHAPSAPTADTFFDIVTTTARAVSLPERYSSIGYASPTLDGADGFARRATTADTAQPHFGFVGGSPSTIAHEYVHTQQDYFEAREYSWLLEGVATFYEHVVGYRMGLLPLSPLSGPSPAEPLLGARRTDVIYEKGAALCFLLDRRLRNLTDGAASLSTVFATLNEHDEPGISHETFKDLVAEASGIRMNSWLDRRITEPFEIDLPPEVTTWYTGPARPRPTVDRLPMRLTPDSDDSWLFIGFAVGPRNQPPETVELRVEIGGERAVTITGMSTRGDNHESASRFVEDGEHVSRRQFGADGPDSLAALSPIRVSLEPTEVGATTFTVSGRVTYRDGETVSLQPAVAGTRAMVATPPPPDPVVVPRTVPVGQQVDMYVLNPEPDLRYHWRFAGSKQPQAVGQRIRRRFPLLGEQTVEVTAIDRTGTETTSSSTVSVREPPTAGLDAHVDSECLLRQRGQTDWLADSESGLPIELVRRCYDSDQKPSGREQRFNHWNNV